MKKMLSVLVCLLMILSCACAEDAPRRIDEDDAAYSWLMEETMALALRYQWGISSTDHSFVLSTAPAALVIPTEELDEELRLMRMQDYSRPTGISFFRADQLLSSESLEDMIRMGYGEKALEEGDEEALARELYLSAASYLNSLTGGAFQAVSDVITVKAASVLPPEVDGPCCAVLYYGGLYVLLIAYCPAEDGGISASAQAIASRSADALLLPAE